MKRTFTAGAGRTAVVVLLSTILFTAAGRAADLKPETIKVWEQYIEEKETEAKSSAGAPLVKANAAANDDRNVWTARSRLRFRIGSARALVVRGRGADLPHC